MRRPIAGAPQALAVDALAAGRRRLGSRVRSSLAVGWGDFTLVRHVRLGARHRDNGHHIAELAWANHRVRYSRTRIRQ
jgi:hypothetical protein